MRDQRLVIALAMTLFATACGLAPAVSASPTSSPGAASRRSMAPGTCPYFAITPVIIRSLARTRHGAHLFPGLPR
jgi:hypothetical protein